MAVLPVNSLPALSATSENSSELDMANVAVKQSPTMKSSRMSLTFTVRADVYRCGKSSKRETSHHVYKDLNAYKYANEQFRHLYAYKHCEQTHRHSVSVYSENKLPSLAY